MRSSIPTPETRLNIKQNHKEAIWKIENCLGYLSTISFRLTNINEELFLNRQLDWESLVIFSKIMLDAFAQIAPLFYGLPEQYFIIRKNKNKIKKN